MHRRGRSRSDVWIPRRRQKGMIFFRFPSFVQDLCKEPQANGSLWFKFNDRWMTRHFKIRTENMLMCVIVKLHLNSFMFQRHQIQLPLRGLKFHFLMSIKRSSVTVSKVIVHSCPRSSIRLTSLKVYALISRLLTLRIRQPISTPRRCACWSLSIFVIFHSDQWLSKFTQQPQGWSSLSKKWTVCTSFSSKKDWTRGLFLFVLGGVWDKTWLRA